MYNSKISKTINEAIQNCIDNGSGRVIFDNIKVEAEWENDNIIGIYIYKDGIIVFDYQEIIK